MNNLTPDYLRERFQHRSEIHQRDNRQKNDLTLPKCGLPTVPKAFAFRGAKVFNLLPMEIIDTQGLSSFQKSVFKNIFNN